MGGFCIEKINGIVGSRQMAIHAIGDKTLCVVHVGGGFPRVVSELDFMAGGTKLGCRGPDHGVIGDTENRKSDNNTQNNKYGRQ